MTFNEVKRKAFADFSEWLKFWCRIHKEIQHIEYDPEKKKFFYGNSSYMDIGELLRQNNGLESSPCIIYDTDVHLSRTQNSRVLNDVHTFYICVLTDTQIDGEEIKRAKRRCKILSLKLMGWLDECKCAAKDKMRGWELGNVDSTAPFLNGWEAVSMRAVQPITIPCVDERDYDLEYIESL